VARGRANGLNPDKYCVRDGAVKVSAKVTYSSHSDRSVFCEVVREVVQGRHDLHGLLFAALVRLHRSPRRPFMPDCAVRADVADDGPFQPDLDPGVEVSLVELSDLAPLVPIHVALNFTHNAAILAYLLAIEVADNRAVLHDFAVPEVEDDHTIF
jgi:hypothetical protein